MFEVSMSGQRDRRSFLASTGVGAAALLPQAAAGEPQTAVRKAAKFKLGIVTYNIAAGWEVPTILRILKATGLYCAELRTTHKHGVEPALAPAARKEVRKQFADAGIALWGLGTVCEFHSADQKVVEKNIESCKQFLQLAADVGARGVKVRPNGLPKEVPVEKTLEQIGKALIPCGQEAANLNLEVWVEVHGGGTAHPPHMKTIMEHCGQANVGVTWNSNKTDVVNGSVTPYFHLLRPWIKECHINELYSDYPYRELFTRFRETGYDRVTLVEIPQALEPAAGELLLRYYKALWNELARD
jgi:sugar phosphate isomerase/epimerase